MAAFGRDSSEAERAAALARLAELEAPTPRRAPRSTASERAAGLLDGRIDFADADLIEHAGAHRDPEPVVERRRRGRRLGAVVAIILAVAVILLIGRAALSVPDDISTSETLEHVSG